MTNYEQMAEKMYAAYSQQAGGLTFDGKPLPSFQELGLERQTCWKAAAEASKMVAPVVLPEPVARRYKDKITGLHHYGERPTFQEEYQNTEPLYTEQQVRELLARDLGAAPQPQVVPGFNHVAAKKLKELQARGYTVAGYSIEKTSESGAVERGFITSGGFVGWWQGQHTNQQPQADALDAIAAAVAAEREACAKLCETFADRVFDTGFTPVEKEHPFSTIAGANQCAADIRNRAAIAAAKEK